MNLVCEHEGVTMKDLDDQADALASMGLGYLRLRQVLDASPSDLVGRYVARGQWGAALALGDALTLTFGLRALGVPEARWLDGLRQDARRDLDALAARRPPFAARDALRAAYPTLARVADELDGFAELRDAVTQAERRPSPDTIRERVQALPAQLRALDQATATPTPVALVSGPVPTFNATLHDQGALVEAYAEHGVVFVLGVVGRGREVPLDHTWSQIEGLAREVCREARSAGAEAVLIGGLSSMAMAVAQEANRRGLGVVEAATLRRRDDQGRFAFALSGVRSVYPTLWARLARWGEPPHT